MDKHASDQQAVIVKNNNIKRSNKNIALFSLVGVFMLASMFSSGWLIGSGRLLINSGSLVPSVTTGQSAPSDGINELYSQLINNFDGTTDDKELLDGIKSGLVSAAGDPFTEYLSAEATEEFNQGLNGTFEGIGAELSREGSFIIIVAPIKGAPAERAGILPQDIIVEIDGEPSTDISVSEAVSRIRGPKGETVTLTIIRNGEQIVVPIVRDVINIESVEWERDNSIGIITISRFGDDTVTLTRQAAEELKKEGATKIILDMRGNPGGLLDASVDVASIWLRKGSTVLEEKRGDEVIKTYKTDKQPILLGLPTVVLIDKGSASASEIVAGALKDNGVATLIGETSYGKGSVQRLIPLNSGGSLKVTIARWFTPAGKNIDKEGIDPDTKVPLSLEDRQANRDPQLDATKNFLNQ